MVEGKKSGGAKAWGLLTPEQRILKWQAYAFAGATVRTRNKVNFIVNNWMLISIALASGGLLLWQVLQGAANAGLSPAAAVLLMNREKAVVLDVCESSEYAAGHIVGAKNVPLGELEAKLVATVKNKTLPLILVCQSGARSGRAVAIAKKLGYEQAQSLGGGLAAWKSANLPVEKA
jgi:rhodanese-related sulfurtransferase